ncbi:Ig-like domain-containing protein, partial [Gilvimarinus algae]
MSTQSATILSLQGKAWAKAPDGSMRELGVGDVIAADEQLITEAGTRIQLDFGDDQPVTLVGEQQVAMSPDLWPETATPAEEASVLEEQFEAILAGLEENDALLMEEQIDDILASLDTNAQLLEGDAFAAILASLDANDALLLQMRVDELLASLDANDALLQDSRFADILQSLAQNDELLGRSEFDVILASLDANDALLQEQRVDDVLAGLDANEALLLEGDGDLLDMLGEAPAAGNAGGGGGHSFVQLGRISETTQDPSFSYGPASSTGNGSTDEDVRANQPPQSQDQSLTTSEDTPITGQVIASDPENQTLTYSLQAGPANGALEFDELTGAFTYTPNDNYNGTDSFTVVVSDGESTTTSVVSLIITAVNDAPEAQDQSLTTPEDTPISGQVEASDVDIPEGDVLSYELDQGPANGSVSVVPETGAFVYTPDPDYFGPDQFTVTVTDSSGATDTAIINIVVTPVNDAPVALDDPNQAIYNTPITGNALDNDFDIDSATLTVEQFIVDGDTTVYGPGDTATIAGVGTFTLTTEGIYTFTPNNGYTGDVPDVTYTVTDGELIDTAIISFTDIPGVGQPGGPEEIDAVNDSVSVNEDSSVSATVASNDDQGNGSASFALATDVSNGTLVFNSDGTYTYTPNANFNGNDSFTYTMTSADGQTDTAVVSITVNPVDDASNLTPDTNVGVEDGGDVTGNVLSNDSDIDSALSVVSFVVAGDPTIYSAGDVASVTGGSLQLNSDGTYAFSPETNWNGNMPQVTYTTNTGSSTTLDIEITPVDDVPTVNIPNDGSGAGGSDISVVEDSTVTGATFTVDAPDGLQSVSIGGSTITLAQLNNASSSNVTVTGAHGTLTVTDYDSASGVITYDYDPSGTSTDHSAGDIIESFSVIVTDVQGDTNTDGASLDIQITDTVPVAQPESNSLGEDDASVSGTVSVISGADADSIGVQNNV